MILQPINRHTPTTQGVMRNISGHVGVELLKSINKHLWDEAGEKNAQAPPVLLSDRDRW